MRMIVNRGERPSGTYQPQGSCVVPETGPDFGSGITPPEPHRKHTQAVAPSGAPLHDQDATTVLGCLLAAALLKEGRTSLRFTREEQFRGFHVEPSWKVDSDGSILVTLNRRENL